MKATVNLNRILGKRDPMIYGQFIEHFHRQIYDGIYCPGSPLSDQNGFRADVLEALGKIAPPVIRWPGGCFVSSYHWRDGVGGRKPSFDKAWRVEDPNTFGTDEFVRYCRLLGSEPYICTNAGTGTAEEMSDWVEYCNLPYEGANAKLRIAGGVKEPHNIKYWSIGNENYGAWEIGAKTAREWSLLVAESAKMMKRVDPSIQLSAAALADINWNMELLNRAGAYLDWISIHEYWNFPDENGGLATYEEVMAYTADIDRSIRKVEGILAATGYLDKIKIAFDEWNLRGWYHPHSHTLTLPSDREKYLKPRDKNDDNSQYTMADAVFTACFLNSLLRHCNTVKMANYSPAVNTRGLIHAHPEGVVLRSTYHVFDLFMNHMGEEVVDLWSQEEPIVTVTSNRGHVVSIAQLDLVATRKQDGSAAISLINKDAASSVDVALRICGSQARSWRLLTVAGSSVDDYNDIHQPDNIAIKAQESTEENGFINLRIPPHSVSVLESC
jgi:alpha-N-arabinofuranosidase